MEQTKPEQTMSTIRYLTLITAALAAGTVLTTAQPAERGPRPERPRAQRPGGAQQPVRVNPFFVMFDANHDGVIDQQEVAKAAEVLKKLDRDGDGKITPQEFRPRIRPGNRPDRPNRDGQGRGERPRRQRPGQPGNQR